MRFINFYVSEAVCSASRSSLLTGCYAQRISIRGALGPRSTHGLHPDETTIAELVEQLLEVVEQARTELGGKISKRKGNGVRPHGKQPKP